MTPFLVLLLVEPDTGQGWRQLFVIVGGVGAAWALLWAWNTRGERGREIDTTPDMASPGREPGESSGELPGLTPGARQQPFVAVFGMPLFWICLGTGVCVNVCWHFYNQ